MQDEILDYLVGPAQFEGALAQLLPNNPSIVY